MDTKKHEKESEVKKEIKKELPKDVPEPSIEPEVKKEDPKALPVEVKEEELSDEDKVRNLARKKFDESKGKGRTWVTMIDPSRNYWNSGDYLHFYIKQGDAKELPEELTPVLEHALSSQNALLREATEEEIMTSLKETARGDLISMGEIKPKRFVQHADKFKL